MAAFKKTTTTVYTYYMKIIKKLRFKVWQSELKNPYIQNMIYGDSAIS